LTGRRAALKGFASGGKGSSRDGSSARPVPVRKTDISAREGGRSQLRCGRGPWSSYQSFKRQEGGKCRSVFGVIVWSSQVKNYSPVYINRAHQKRHGACPRSGRCVLVRAMSQQLNGCLSFQMHVVLKRPELDKHIPESCGALQNPCGGAPQQRGPLTPQHALRPNRLHCR
jgi:hypothetical protein